MTFIKYKLCHYDISPENTFVSFVPVLLQLICSYLLIFMIRIIFKIFQKCFFFPEYWCIKWNIHNIIEKYEYWSIEYLFYIRLTFFSITNCVLSVYGNMEIGCIQFFSEYIVFYLLHRTVYVLTHLYAYINIILMKEIGFILCWSIFWIVWN